MALGLSNSAPGVEILAENYNEIDDLCWRSLARLDRTDNLFVC
jgi:hypothetical protein